MRVLVTESTNQFVAEHPIGYHTRYIWFDMAESTGVPGGYWEVVSYNAFFHGRKNRNHAPKFNYHATIGDDDFDHKLKYSYHVRVPNIVVKTIWDFYTLIGYDHKRNKYAT